MKSQKQIFRPLLFLFLLTCLLSGLVGVVRVPVNAAPKLANTLDVVINEIAWGGTLGSTADEWIELYNPTASDIDITNWTLVATSGTPSITLSGIIPTNGYFLLERTDDTTTSVTANQFFTGAIANNTAGGDSFTLRDQLNNIIDTANISGGLWPSGSVAPTFATMERISIISDVDSNWGSNNGTIINGTDVGGNPIQGTPKQQNSIFAPPPPPPPIEVVINEVAWSGTRASSDDEWIELYNPGASIDISGWRLVSASGSLDITFLTGTTIAPGGYFLIERRQLATSVTANLITPYPWALSDSGEILRLRKPDGTIVDTANSNGGAWPSVSGAPNYPSMERTAVIADSDFSWVTFSGTPTALDAAGTGIYGTPGAPNSQPNVTPTFTATFTATATSTGTPTSTPTATATYTATPTASGTPTNSPTPAGFLSVVINEVAWMGTGAATADEWIELYNPSSTVTVNLAGWVLRADDTSPSITFPAGKSIPPGGFFLLERTDDDTVVDVTADLIYTGELNNSFEVLRLFDSSNRLIDTANSNGGNWPAGITNSTTYGTMERRGIVADSDTAWVTNVNPASWTKHDARGTSSVNYLIRGTPKYANWALSVTLTPSPVPTKTTAPTPFRTSTPAPPPPPPLIGINEFVPRPGHDWNNDGVVNVGDEYIELINHGVINVNLSGYSLDDEANVGSSPYRLPAVTLKPGERMVFYGADTGLLLSDGGDGVRLLKPNGQLGDAYNYSVVKYPDQAYCRLPDNGGLDDWNQDCFPTPGLKNSLNGNFPKPPTGENVDQTSSCPISDVLPVDFVWAECPSFGNIWSRFYWDVGGWFGEKNIPDIDSKWDVYVD